MNKYLIFSIIVLIFFSQCSGTAHKRSMGEILDDNVVAVKLRTKLVKTKGIPSNKIGIHIWKGIVTLYGTVEKQEQIDKTIVIAEQQAGVKEVKAYLVLKSLQELPPKKKKTGFWPFSKKKSTKPVKAKPVVVEEDLAVQPPQEEAEKKSSESETTKKPKETKDIDNSKNSKKTEDFEEFEY